MRKLLRRSAQQTAQLARQSAQQTTRFNASFKGYSNDFNILQAGRLFAVDAFMTNTPQIPRMPRIICLDAMASAHVLEAYLARRLLDATAVERMSYYIMARCGGDIGEDANG